MIKNKKILAIMSIICAILSTKATASAMNESRNSNNEELEIENENVHEQIESNNNKSLHLNIEEPNDVKQEDIYDVVTENSFQTPRITNIRNGNNEQNNSLCLNYDNNNSYKNEIYEICNNPIILDYARQIAEILLYNRNTKKIFEEELSKLVKQKPNKGCSELLYYKKLIELSLEKKTCVNDNLLLKLLEKNWLIEGTLKEYAQDIRETCPELKNFENKNFEKLGSLENILIGVAIDMIYAKIITEAATEKINKMYTLAERENTNINNKIDLLRKKVENIKKTEIMMEHRKVKTETAMLALLNIHVYEILDNLIQNKKIAIENSSDSSIENSSDSSNEIIKLCCKIIRDKYKTKYPYKIYNTKKDMDSLFKELKKSKNIISETKYIENIIKPSIKNINYIIDIFNEIINNNENLNVEDYQVYKQIVKKRNELIELLNKTKEEAISFFNEATKYYNNLLNIPSNKKKLHKILKQNLDNNINQSQKKFMENTEDINQDQNLKKAINYIESIKENQNLLKKTKTELTSLKELKEELNKNYTKLSELKKAIKEGSTLNGLTPLEIYKKYNNPIDECNKQIKEINKKILEYRKKKTLPDILLNLPPKNQELALIKIKEIIPAKKKSNTQDESINILKMENTEDINQDQNLKKAINYIESIKKNQNLLKKTKTELTSLKELKEELNKNHTKLSELKNAIKEDSTLNDLTSFEIYEKYTNPINECNKQIKEINKKILEYRKKKTLPDILLNLPPKNQELALIKIKEIIPAKKKSNTQGESTNILKYGYCRSTISIDQKKSKKRENTGFNNDESCVSSKCKKNTQEKETPKTSIKYDNKSNNQKTTISTSTKSRYKKQNCSHGSTNNYNSISNQIKQKNTGKHKSNFENYGQDTPFIINNKKNNNILKFQEDET